MMYALTSAIPHLPNLFTTWTYRLPTSKAEAQIRSRLNSYIFRHMEETAKATLGDGRREDGLVRGSRFLVEIAGGLRPEIGLHLPAGAWLDKATGTVGHDLIELLAYIGGLNYRVATAILAERFGILASDDADDGSISGDWLQEKSPLQVPHDMRSTAPLGKEIWYRNRVGTIIGRAHRFTCQNGEDATIYKILLRHRKSPFPQWVEATPEQPYMIFNADRLTAFPSRMIVFVPDEFTAADIDGQNDFAVFSAIPGGLKNLPHADLTSLTGRTVRVVFDAESLPQGRLVEQALWRAGVSDATFALEPTGRAYPFSELPPVAEGRGVVLLPSAEDGVSSDIPKPMKLSTFLDLELPEREFVIDPILHQQALGMIYAPKGVGKTHMALGLAVAVATGSEFLRYKASEPRRVLYVDGEMPAEIMQTRLAAMVTGFGKEPPDGFFRILNREIQEGNLPDVSTEAGQATLMPLLQDVQLLVLDNLSTLCRSGRENEAESWGSIQNWLLELRRLGIAVLLIHHSGKNGSQRGTSRREDVLDTVLRLQRPEGYDPSQGARFEVHVEKGRSLFGLDAEPFGVQLEYEGGLFRWSMLDLADSQQEHAAELLRAGRTVREVAEESGLSKSVVGRLRKAMEERGEL